ncbi:MAG: GntR family transcriptional regulator [Sarcina sp.]
MELYEKLKGESSKEYAYRTLKRNIMNLDLKPGQGLSETDIAEVFGLSRTPIREVVMKLKDDYLIEVIPQRGTYIALIDKELMNEGTFMRTVLEKEILKLACVEFPEELIDELEKNIFAQKLISEKTNSKMEMHRLDQEFHEIIFYGVKKKTIWTSIQKISTHYNRVRLLSELNKSTSHIVDEHEKILTIIKNKDIDAVDEIINLHIVKPTEKWAEFYSEDNQYKEYFKAH